MSISKNQQHTSNPFSTGGGGYNFERHVQAVFLLSLLSDGFSPAMDYPIVEVHFQTKNEGFYTDDLAVFVSCPSGTGKLLCQIKNDITATKENAVFRDVLTSAWKDFSNESFNKEIDKIALITNVAAKSSVKALQIIHEQATSSSNAADFLRRIGKSNFVNDDTRKKYDVIKDCLRSAKGSELLDVELFEFCQSFVLIVFDGNYEGSVHEALCKSLIRSKSNEDPRRVWTTLTEYAGQCNQKAAHVSKENVGLEIKEMFGYRLKDTEIRLFSPSKNWAYLVLIGAWDENNDVDKLAIETITDMSFSVFLGFAREQLNADVPYISLSNGIWRVSYRKDIFSCVKDYLYDDTVKKAFQVTSELVREISRRFTDENTFGFVMPADGWFSNSSVFRKSMCEGLCLLANGTPPVFSSNHLIDREAISLTRNLFRGSSWKTFAELGELLPIIAELSPTAFIQELESFSVKRIQELKMLFPKAHSQSFEDGNHLTQILCSLEMLAWIPDYFGACIRCLSTIELVGYEKTNYVNTPFNSIVSIMNYYCPQTFASISQKQNAIMALQKDSPELCWKVIRALLPESSFTLSDTPKPQYINLAPFERDVPQSETHELRQYYVDTALRMSSDSAERLAELSAHTSQMSSKMIIDYLNKIISSAQNWTDEFKYSVWDSLCALRVKEILKSECEKPDSEWFSLLEQTISVTTPESKWYQYLRLYSNSFDEYDLDNTPHSWKKRDNDRKKAICDLYNTFGIDSVISFGNRVNNLHDVGCKLGESLNRTQIVGILEIFSDNAESLFFPSVLSGFIRVNGIDVLDTINLERYDVLFRAEILCAAPFEPETFSLAERYLPDKKIYWKKVSSVWFSTEWSKQTLEYVIKELMESRRCATVVHSLGYIVAKLDLEDDLLVTILREAVSELSLNQIDEYAVCNIIKKLQMSSAPNIDVLAEIEFLYLPFFSNSSTVRPKALYCKLSNDDVSFCRLMECVFKPNHEEHKRKNYSEGLKQRLFLLTYNYFVVPGIDWNGAFNAERFQKWINNVILWANETDRLEVTQQIIGNGLSHAKTENGLPDDVIMAELNKSQNNEMRIGYQMGIQNQRGVHWVDPEGKPELELAKKYSIYAKAAEERGYSRFAETLKRISNSYLLEAEEIKQRNRQCSEG